MIHLDEPFLHLTVRELDPIGAEELCDHVDNFRTGPNANWSLGLHSSRHGVNTHGVDQPFGQLSGTVDTPDKLVGP